MADDYCLIFSNTALRDIYFTFDYKIISFYGKPLCFHFLFLFFISCAKSKYFKSVSSPSVNVKNLTNNILLILPFFGK